MKKLVAVLLIVITIPLFAFAETDISSMSFDELIALRQSLMMEIMKRPEWSETTLEAGTYKIGKDIPSGYYKAHPVNSFMEIKLFSGSKEVDYIMVYGEDLGKLYLEDGLTLKTNGTILLTPYAGI